MVRRQPESRMAREETEDAIIAYKSILTQIIDNRPSGTRQRLATELGKHRSFVTQITSPTYATPFRVCHFSAAEQERFLGAYQNAHPGRLPEPGPAERLRHLSLMVPDLGDERK